ncbi:MAG: hypothetical protein AAGA92_11175 [Planctomycetota bacterium]
MDSSSDPRESDLVRWLREQGHGEAEVERIMEKVKEYDEKTVRESVFDSLESGSFDIAKIIDEALGQDEPEG